MLGQAAVTWQCNLKLPGPSNVVPFWGCYGAWVRVFTTHALQNGSRLKGPRRLCQVGDLRDFRAGAGMFLIED